MGRKKNVQPKRRLESSDAVDSGNKRPRLPTYCFPDRRTTNVIPAEADHPLLKNLPTFLKRLQERLPQMIREYHQAVKNGKSEIDGWYKGFRLINGNRIEIKVLSEWLNEQFGNDECNWQPLQLIDYAQNQAQKDERIINNILNNHVQVQFSEWSMIVSKSCQAQTIHIDVPPNNYQFGLVLQDGIPGTMVLSKHGTSPETPEQLCSTVWKEAPQSLKDCILKNAIIKERLQKVLNAYGPLLIPKEELEANMVGGPKPLVMPLESTIDATNETPPMGGSELKCGDLICTAGGIPHAGPACETFRVVVFAAASPTKESLYNVDEQYFAHSALLFVIQIVWDALGKDGEDSVVEPSSKRWLLHKLAKMVQDDGPAPIENHNYVSKAFTALMHQMATVYQHDDKESTIDGSSSHNATSERINQVISTFLQKNGSESELSLFQYKDNKIWQVAGSLG